MAPPSALALLDAWEQARGGGLAVRVTALLGLVHPNAAPADLLELPLGQRNRALLALHVALAGPEVQCVVRCAHCPELNEMSLRAGALMLPTGTTPAGGFRADIDAWTLHFRLPTTADLVVAMAAGSLDAMRRVVAERCVLSIEPPAEGPMPERVIDAVSHALGAVDPAAELVFHLRCVACGERFTTLLDPTYFVWRELEDAGHRLLAEVDALARVYHWPQQEILSLSPARRSAYLDLVGA
jgi:hypothetical protein